MNIYVSNLSFAVESDDLRGFFEEYGEVTSAKIITDKETRRSRGFGFVEMSDDSAAAKAVAELNGAMVQGRSISVTEARPKEEKSGSFGGGGGQRSGGYSGGGNKRW
jgi:RNA recognition motif-containing protein